jgi:hypothetical protein
VLSRVSERVSRRPSVIVLALILVFLMAGTVYAASRGNPWRLGYVETLNSYSTGIVGARGGAEMFKIKNTAGASGSRAIRAENANSAATLYIKNAGSGSAAEFVTGPGRAPFKVNQTTKVAKLNADLLDGVSASAFRPVNVSLGATQTGVWGLAGATSGHPLLTINYLSALPAAIAAGNTHYVIEGAFTTECPALGQAAAGHLCVYERFSNTLAFDYIFNPEDYQNGSGKSGFVMYMTPSSAGANAVGVWAVTAPTALASLSEPSARETGETTAGR